MEKDVLVDFTGRDGSICQLVYTRVIRGRTGSNQ